MYKIVVKTKKPKGNIQIIDADGSKIVDKLISSDCKLGVLK